MVTDRVLCYIWTEFLDNSSNVITKDIGQMVFDEETPVSAVRVMRKNYTMSKVWTSDVRVKVLCAAVTLMRTSSGPGDGIWRVPIITGLPISVTKSAFCIVLRILLKVDIW